MNSRLSTFLVIVALIKFQIVVQSMNYLITRNVEIPVNLLLTATLKSGVMSPSICGHLCMAADENDCHAAAFNEKWKMCYLFPRGLALVLDIVEKSDFISLQDECSHSMSNTQGDGTLWDQCNLQAPAVYEDCQDAFNAGESIDGMYYLTPPNSSISFQAHCIFDQSHGWTVVLRRLKRVGHFMFLRSFEELQRGVGSPSSEHFLGLEILYWLTRSNQNMSVKLEDWDGEFRHGNYSTFYVDSETDNYTLHVDGYSGDAGDSLATHNGMRFSTYNAGITSCAFAYTASWWYYDCHCSNLLGIYYDGGSYPTNRYATGLSWCDWKGYYYGYLNVILMITR